MISWPTSTLMKRQHCHNEEHRHLFRRQRSLRLGACNTLASFFDTYIFARLVVVVFSFFFFFLGTFFRLQYPCGSLCTAPQLQPTRMGRRLLATPAKSSCRAGSGPPALHSPPGATQAGVLQRLAALRRPGCHSTSRPTLPLPQPGER